MDEIEYSKYDLDELYEAMHSIDKEKYPRNYLKLTEEISRKEKVKRPEKKPAVDFFSRKAAPSGYAIMMGFYLISVFEYSQGYLYLPGRIRKGARLIGTNATLAFVGINLMVASALLFYLMQKKGLEKTPWLRRTFWFMMGPGILLLLAGIFKQGFRF